MEDHLSGSDSARRIAHDPGPPSPAPAAVRALGGLPAWAQASRAWSVREVRWAAATRSRLLIAAELLVVTIWALIFTRPFLDLDPLVVPNAQDYSSILTHHVWTRAVECGWCALWFGSTRGGSPAFVDGLFTSMLNPLVIVTTLGWGVPNGAKLTLVGSFILAGLAQWWLGYLLGVGRIARLFGATLVVVAAHLASRMDVAAPGMLLATASAALVLPAVILLARTGTRRAAILVALTLASTGLAGQGYIQAGLAFTLPPAVLLLVRWDRAWLLLLLRRVALAFIITPLLAAPFLLPFLHFLPEFSKQADTSFRSAQPFAYVPLNLVINDRTFFNTDALGKLPLPTINVNYVGWGPVLLALWGLGAARTSEQRRMIRFLVALAVLALWFASSAPLSTLSSLSPVPWLSQQFFPALRFPGFMAGLAIAPLVGLSALGVDRLVRAKWPRLNLTVAAGSSAPFSLLLDARWLAIIPLLWMIGDARSFTSGWIGTHRLAPEVPAVIEALRTPDSQWVTTPYGEQFYTEPAIAAGLKLADDWRDWGWKNRQQPEPVLQAHRGNELPGMTERNAAGMRIFAAPPGREYAAVTLRDGQRRVCTGQSAGGNVDVSCDVPAPGVLVVKENSWTGWQASVDGRSVPLLMSGQWLSVNLDAGSHTIEFRYRPWDVPVSLLLCLAGIALAVREWMVGESPALVA